MQLNLLAIVTTAAIAVSSVAHAATCNDLIADGVTTIADAVTNTDGCQLGTDSQDSQAQVNADNLFGFNDWVFIAKDNGLNGTDAGIASALTITGDTLSGTWAVDSLLFDTYANLLLVFKAANDNAGFTPDTYVSYLIDSKAPFSGDYTSMFKKNNAGDISHVSLYGQGKPDDDDDGPGPVPLPAGGVLLLSGLAGLGAYARRKKRK